MPKRIEKRANNKYILTVVNGYVAGQQKMFRKTVVCKNSSEAEKEYALFKAECLKGQHLASTDDKMTLETFYDFWIENYAKANLSDSSIKYNDYLFERIKTAFGSSRLDKITGMMCVSFFEELRTLKGARARPLSSSTVRKHYVLLNELFNFAVKWDVLPMNILYKIDPPKVKKDIKILPMQEDLSKLANHILSKKETKSKTELKHKLWFMLALGLGLRREEIFGLQVKDINLKTKIISINRAAIYLSGEGVKVVPPKTKTSVRKLTMPNMIHSLMKQYITSIKVMPLEGWLFCSNNKITQPDAFNNMLERACKKLGIKKVSPHTLRHLYGSNLIKQGVDIALTSQQLGHTNKSFTVDTYIHVVEKTDNKAAIASQTALKNILK